MKSNHKKRSDPLWSNLLHWLQQELEAPVDWNGLIESIKSYLDAAQPEASPRVRLRYLERTVKWLAKKYAAVLEPEQVIDFYFKIGFYSENAGELDRAARAFRRSISLSEPHRSAHRRSRALCHLGHVHARQNRWQAAEQAYSESLSLSQNTGDKIGEARARNGLGLLHFEQGRLAAAAEQLEAALELAESIDDDQLAAMAGNNLGALTNVRGDWQKALTYYGKSLAKFEAIGDKLGMAETHHNMALTYADHQKWSEAGINYEKSYLLAQEIGDARMQALIRLNRVELYLALADYQLAEALCKLALNAFERLNDHLGQADAHKFLGMIQQRRQQWHKAAIHLNESIQLSREYGSLLCEAESRLEFGILLKQTGKRTRARSEMEEALRLFKKIEAQQDIARAQAELKKLNSLATP